MKKEHIVQARNHSYELMLIAQNMMDYAESERDRKIADYLYYMAWGSYMMMCELGRMPKHDIR